jgi:hypothetical protein
MDAAARYCVARTMLVSPTAHTTHPRIVMMPG